MYLSIASHLASWARNEAKDDTSKVVFSTIATFLCGAITVNAARATLNNLSVARNDIANVVKSPDSEPLREVA